MLSPRGTQSDNVCLCEWKAVRAAVPSHRADERKYSSSSVKRYPRNVHNLQCADFFVVVRNFPESEVLLKLSLTVRSSDNNEHILSRGEVRRTKQLIH